jgi:hypothetical protein
MVTPGLPIATAFEIPLLAGNLICDRRLDDQDLLVFLGHRQVRQRRGRRGRADRDIDLVVLIGLGECRLGQIRLALVVLGDDDDLAAVDGHGALGGVFQAHAQAGFGLLGVSLQRAGFSVDQADLQVIRLRDASQQNGGHSRNDP